jgi:hypothetical protein
MKKLLLFVFTIAFFTIAVSAQKKITYPVVVSFNSICCGVPDNAPVMQLIKTFKRQNRIRSISVDRIGPMGREGEYYLAFRLKEMSRSQKTKFIRELKRIVPTMTDKGSADVKENMLIDKNDISRVTISTQQL